MFNLCSSTWPKSQLRADWASLARRTMLCWSIRFCASRRPLMVFGSHIIETRSTLRPFLIGVNSTQKGQRSEEHTSELQSLMRISYAVFCLKKKKTKHKKIKHEHISHQQTYSSLQHI